MNYKTNDDDCPLPAVIPYTVVDTVDDLKGLYACLVLVKKINTTYYIDFKGHPMVWHQAAIPYDDYDYEENPLGVRSNAVIDETNNRMIYYNALGEYRFITLEEED